MAENVVEQAKKIANSDNLPDKAKIEQLNQLIGAAVNLDQLNMNEWNRTKDMWQGGLATANTALQWAAAGWKSYVEFRMLGFQEDIIEQRGTQIDNAYNLQTKNMDLEYAYRNKIADNDLKKTKMETGATIQLAKLNAGVKKHQIDKTALSDIFQQNKYSSGVPAFTLPS